MKRTVLDNELDKLSSIIEAKMKISMKLLERTECGDSSDEEENREEYDKIKNMMNKFPNLNDKDLEAVELLL